MSNCIRICNVIIFVYVIVLINNYDFNIFITSNLLNNSKFNINKSLLVIILFV